MTLRVTLLPKMSFPRVLASGDVSDRASYLDQMIVFIEKFTRRNLELLVIYQFSIKCANSQTWPDIRVKLEWESIVILKILAGFFIFSDSHSSLELYYNGESLPCVVKRGPL